MYVPPEYRNILSSDPEYNHAEYSISDLFMACWPFCRQREEGSLYLVRKQEYRKGYLVALEYHEADDTPDPTSILARSDPTPKESYRAMHRAMCFEYGEPTLGSNWRSADDKKIVDAFYEALSKL